MKRYIKTTVEYLTDSDIVDKFSESGLETTSNPYDAIWLLRDGTLINGVYDGVRSEDHRCAECLIDDYDRYDSDFWQVLFDRTGMIALMPETQTAWLSPGQNITSKQQAVLDEINYEVERS